MHMPEGNASGWRINPVHILEEVCPVIGTEINGYEKFYKLSFPMPLITK